MPTFARLLGWIWKVWFRSKKVAKGITELKKVKCKAQTWRNKLSPPKDLSLPPLREILQSLLASIRHCFPNLCCPGPLLHIPIEIRLSSQMVSSCENIPVHWQIAVLPPYSSLLSLLDYDTWGVLQAIDNLMVHPKMGTLNRTIWQLWASKVKQCCFDIAMHSSHAWKSASLLAEHIGISSQANILMHHLKPFSGLRIMKKQNYWEYLYNKFYCTLCIVQKCCRSYELLHFSLYLVWELLSTDAIRYFEIVWIPPCTKCCTVNCSVIAFRWETTIVFIY